MNWVHYGCVRYQHAPGHTWADLRYYWLKVWITGVSVKHHWEFVCIHVPVCVEYAWGVGGEWRYKGYAAACWLTVPTIESEDWVGVVFWIYWTWCP